MLSMDSQDLTSDPRPSYFLGSRTKPGAQRPAPVGTAETVLPYNHYPHQPLRYASPLPAPCGRAQEMRAGPQPAGGRGQPSSGGSGRGLPFRPGSWLCLQPALPHSELRLFLRMMGFTGTCPLAPIPCIHQRKLPGCIQKPEKRTPLCFQTQARPAQGVKYILQLPWLQVSTPSKDLRSSSQAPEF